MNNTQFIAYVKSLFIDYNRSLELASGYYEDSFDYDYENTQFEEYVIEKLLGVTDETAIKLALMDTIWCDCGHADLVTLK